MGITFKNKNLSYSGEVLLKVNSWINRLLNACFRLETVTWIPQNILFQLLLSQSVYFMFFPINHYIACIRNYQILVCSVIYLQFDCFIFRATASKFSCRGTKCVFVAFASWIWHEIQKADHCFYFIINYVLGKWKTHSFTNAKKIQKIKPTHPSSECSSDTQNA